MESYKIINEKTATKYYLERLASYIYQEGWHALVQEEKQHLKEMAKRNIDKIKTDDGW